MNGRARGYGRAHRLRRAQAVFAAGRVTGTEWDRWSLLGSATGVTSKHGLGLTPMPGPNEAIVTISAEDGAQASAIVPKAAIPEALLAGLEAGQAANRARQDEYLVRVKKESG